MANVTPRGAKWAPAGGAPLDRTGLGAAIAAYGLWGFLPIYFKILAPAGAFEVVLHRALWALPTMAIALVLSGRWRAALAQVMRPRAIGALSLTALLIAGNWLVFVWIVQSGRVLEASLGYFINPLVSVAMGAVLLGERLSRAGQVALALAAIGVVNQMIVVGEPPVWALVLAFSFATYGYLRKIAKVDAGPGLLAETALLAPIALAGIVALEATGAGHAITDARTGALLVLCGPVTALPLFLFAVGARRLPLMMVGLLQFIAPSLQFVTGLAYGEPFTWSHAITFAFVWTGLVIFTRDLMRAGRGLRRVPP